MNIPKCTEHMFSMSLESCEFRKSESSQGETGQGYRGVLDVCTTNYIYVPSN